MNKHLEFINGQWCVVDHDTGERTGSKKDVGRQPNQEVEPEEMFGSQVYIESFTLNTDDRPVYPYKVISPLGLRCINFTPITILYGSNGSGKSTVLNVIANSIGITRKTEGSTNAYFASYLEKCSYQSAAPVLPIDDSSFVRSEDIMDGIMKGRKRYSSANPFRPWHRRKNWFVGVHFFKPLQLETILERDITYETMRSSGPGGQNVNKVETAVRAIHVPSGTTVLASDMRSQTQNKKLARERLLMKLSVAEEMKQQQQAYDVWMNHNTLERGNPIKRFKGDL